jgi:pyruvate/2-oxoglutarate dehydrogenase complex dihydrolipoamide dehydrogenase (E3) component
VNYRRRKRLKGVMSMPHYDAIVIGAGQAGNPLSQKLADRGWAVALVEREHLGGTCVNTGCTPTKTMMASAQVAYYTRNAGRWGVRAGEVSVDLLEVLARKDRIVSQARFGLNRKVEERKTLHLYRGHARFIGPHEVRVGEERLDSDRIFIDTGAAGDSRVGRVARHRLPGQRQHHAVNRGPGALTRPRRRLHRHGVRADVPPVR